jgi:hypothetical protein
VIGCAVLSLALLSCHACHWPGSAEESKQELLTLENHPRNGQLAEKHFEDLHVRVFGEAAVVNGAVIETTEHGERKALFTDAFAFRDGRWQAVSAQELPVARP